MKVFLSAVLLIMVASCHSNRNKNPISTTAINLKETTSKKEMAEWRIDTIKINNTQMIKVTKDSLIYYLSTVSGDTVARAANYYDDMEITDIDHDGYNDIRIYVSGNTPNQCENYLYDAGTKKFILLKNCDLDLKLIKGSHVFFTYHHAGCADNNWESHLLRIKDYTAIELGYICGQACDSPRQIKVYKTSIEDESANLVDSLPYDKVIPKYEDKWDFIERYWQKNHQRYE